MINFLSSELMSHFFLLKFRLVSGSFGLIQTVSAGLKISLAIYITGLIIALLFMFSAIYSDQNKESKIFTFSIIMIYSVGLLTRLFTSVIFEGHPVDISCFKAWASSASNSMSTFYTNGAFADYPPLYIYVLFFVERIRLLFFHASPDWVHTLIIKLPSIIGDLLCSYVLYKFTLKNQGKKFALILSFVYLFNPVTILVSCIWGQVDGLFMLLLVLATMRLYDKNYIEATVWYALTVLFKPQGLIFLPVLFFVIVKEKNIKLLGKCFVAGIITFVLPLIPFTGSQRFDWIFKLYFNTATSYKGASLNAYNLFALLGANWKDDSEKLFIFNYGTWGMIFIVLVTIVTAWYILTSKNPAIPTSSSAMLIAGVYVLSSKMHERYIFPVLLLLLLACAISRNKKLLLLYSGFTITAFLNILQVFTLSQNNIYWVPANDPVLRAVSLINLVLMLITFIITIKCSYKNNKEISFKSDKIKSTYYYNFKKKGIR